MYRRGLRPSCFVTQRNRPSSLLDFFPGCRANFIGFHLHAMLQFPIAKDFYSYEITADELRLTQQLFVDGSSSLKCIEIIKINHRIAFIKGGLIKPSLRQSSN